MLQLQLKAVTVKLERNVEVTREVTSGCCPKQIATLSLVVAEKQRNYHILVIAMRYTCGKVIIVGISDPAEFGV